MMCATNVCHIHCNFCDIFAWYIFCPLYYIVWMNLFRLSVQIVLIFIYIYSWKKYFQLILNILAANVEILRWKQQPYETFIIPSAAWRKRSLHIHVLFCSVLLSAVLCYAVRIYESNRQHNRRNITAYIKNGTKKRKCRIKMTRKQEGLYNHISLTIMWIVIMCWGKMSRYNTSSQLKYQHSMATHHSHELRFIRCCLCWQRHLPNYSMLAIRIYNVTYSIRYEL